MVELYFYFGIINILTLRWVVAIKLHTMANYIPHFYDFFTLHRCDTKFTLKPNWHDDVEILFQTEGTNTFLIDGVDITLNKGDIFIVNPGFTHSQTGKLNNLTMVLVISRKFLLTSGIKDINGTFCDKINDKTVWQKFNKVLDVYFTYDEYREVTMRIALLDLSTYIFKNYYTPNTTTSKNHKINNVITYINDNYANEITLEQLAQKFNYNKCHLSVTFKKETGYTIIGYVNSMRCNYADALLKSGSIKTKEIATMCGFGSVSNFYKTYKALRGKTPSETKLEHKKFLETGVGLGRRPI